jgi:hypothetical protein
MTVSQVYRKYKVLPGMQKHMLEVSAVAAYLCDNIKEIVDKDNIVRALTLHDIGKIVTVKLGLIPGTWGKKLLIIGGKYRMRLGGYMVREKRQRSIFVEKLVCLMRFLS